MFDEAKQAALADIAHEWNKAEKLIKQAERLRGEVVQPSVNELRYAGRRLVDALQESLKPDGDQAKFDGFITDCQMRCLCAQHDAVDASVLFIQKVIKEYEDEFGLGLMIEKFPWLADTRARLAEMDDIIIDCREKRGTRCEGYDQLADDHLPALVLDIRRLLTNRQALEELVSEKAERDARDAGRFKINIYMAIGLAVLGLLGGWALSKLPWPGPAKTEPAATSVVQTDPAKKGV